LGPMGGARLTDGYLARTKRFSCELSGTLMQETPSIARRPEIKCKIFEVA